MPPVEVGGLVVGGLVGVAALITAVFKINEGARALWGFLRKVLHTVDIITAIPARLDAQDQALTAVKGDVLKVKTDLWQHIEYADGRNEVLDAVAERTETLLSLGRDVHHEVKHNGGSSIKDAIARVESGVQGLYQPTGSTSPVTVIPIVTEPGHRAARESA